MIRSFELVLLFNAVIWIGSMINAFLVPCSNHVLYHQHAKALIARTTRPSTTTTTSLKSKTKATLTDETEWRLRFVLRNVSTENNKKVNEIFIIQGKFLEEEGYEPPQGTFMQQTQNINDEKDNSLPSSSLRITSSSWKLSEDPNDRKDGLWIWGLFKEPLYPFMLLRLETDSIPLSGGDSIKPLQLYAQINHKRDQKIGAVLEGADLKIRQIETIKADPFGVSKVDVYEEVSVGNLSIQQIIPGVKDSSTSSNVIIEDVGSKAVKQ